MARNKINILYIIEYFIKRASKCRLQLATHLSNLIWKFKVLIQGLLSKLNAAKIAFQIKSNPFIDHLVQSPFDFKTTNFINNSYSTTGQKKMLSLNYKVQPILTKRWTQNNEFEQKNSLQFNRLVACYDIRLITCPSNINTGHVLIQNYK